MDWEHVYEPTTENTPWIKNSNHVDLMRSFFSRRGIEIAFKWNGVYVLHQNRKVVTLTDLTSLAVPEVVILTTSCAANDDKFVNMMNFPFQCCQICSIKSVTDDASFVTSSLFHCRSGSRTDEPNVANSRRLKKARTHLTVPRNLKALPPRKPPLRTTPLRPQTVLSHRPTSPHSPSTSRWNRHPCTPHQTV